MTRSLIAPIQATEEFIEEGELLDNPPYSYSYADQAAREGASGFVAGDVGKLARQIDNNSLWMLTATTPSWKDMAASSSSSVSVQDEGTPVTNTPHTTVNFTGAGVSVSDGGGGVADVLIPGGGTSDLDGVLYCDTPEGDAEIIFCEVAPGEIELVENVP